MFTKSKPHREEQKYITCGYTTDNFRKNKKYVGEEQEK